MAADFIEWQLVGLHLDRFRLRAFPSLLENVRDENGLSANPHRGAQMSIAQPNRRRSSWGGLGVALGDIINRCAGRHHRSVKATAQMELPEAPLDRLGVEDCGVG